MIKPLKTVEETSLCAYTPLKQGVNEMLQTSLRVSIACWSKTSFETVSE